MFSGVMIDKSCGVDLVSFWRNDLALEGKVQAPVCVTSLEVKIP